MSINQSELFAGNSWTAIYRAFTEINFNAFDFATIRAAMIDYIRQNYPEDFNDWVESSEFIAILDLLAYMGQSLAFRMDINARENFMDVARRRESVLRLARFLSYSVRRNYPARGLVKLTEVRTTNDVYDSIGRNLNNQTIRWDDPTNPDWFEQWILVLNDSLIGTNPFGTPLKSDVFDGVQTHLYRMSNQTNSAGTYPFTSYVDNQSVRFEAVNADFDSQIGFKEQTPNPKSAFHIVYRSDGNGNSSKDTGFFLYFKQGSLQYNDFLVNEPRENRTIMIPTSNINELDVWVQSVSDGGQILSGGNWTRVGAVPTDNATKVVLNGDNITYNSISPDIQNIFQVVTQENDQIMLRFGDGRFGDIPTGNLRVWYRVSANANLGIRPDDIQNVKINIPYTSNNNTARRISFSVSLKENIDNALQTEGNEEVRRRAALVNKTQGRMVSGEDYNTLPISTNLAVKIKAVNRTYSGQSRYLDLNDPTGTYQDTNVFGDDGCLYIQDANSYSEIPLAGNPTSQDISGRYITPLLLGTEIRDYLVDQWRRGTTASPLYDFTFPNGTVTWQSLPSDVAFGNAGVIKRAGTAIKLGSVATNQNAPEAVLTKGAMLKFRNAGWATIVSIDGDGDGVKSNGRGQVLINEEVQTGDIIDAILPAYVNRFSQTSASRLVSLLDAKRSFGIGYDFKALDWYFIEPSSLNGQGQFNLQTRGTDNDSSWMIKCEYSTLNWRVTARGLQYVFESEKSCKFFFVNGFKGVDSQTGRVSNDLIKILKANSLSEDISFHLEKTYNYGDGFMEPRRVFLKFFDSDIDGQADNPESFSAVVAEDALVFHQRKIDVNGYEYYELMDIPTSRRWINNGLAPTLANDVVGYRVPAVGDKSKGTFYVGASGSNQIINDPLMYTAHLGRRDLTFQWKHYAPSDHRIDPSISNIVDLFVLSREYSDRMTTWRNSNGALADMPKSPSERQLRLSFSELEQFKMFSDEMVWRPVKFKILFGPAAAPELRAKFKVVKSPGTTMSDGEIKSKIVEFVRDYFSIDNWDFGETFYFTNLASYIHRRLSTSVASVNIVPTGENQSFGALFEIRSQPDELFFTTIQVSDIEIIPANTQTSLRIK